MTQNDAHALVSTRKLDKATETLEWDVDRSHFGGNYAGFLQ